MEVDLEDPGHGTVGPTRLVQYRTFSSCVDGAVWHKLTHLKLDRDGLAQTRRALFAHYSYLAGLPPLIALDGAAFNLVPDAGKFAAISHGILLNKNTIEEFRDCDKAALLDDEGKLLWEDVECGKCLEDPSLLSRFLLLTFADLKKYNYYYWFAFPVPNFPSVMTYAPPSKICDVLKKNQMTALAESHSGLDIRQKSYFYIESLDDGLHCRPLSAILSIDIHKNYKFLIETFPVFGYLDPSSDEYPGWPLRNFIAMLVYKCPHLQGQRMSILGLRLKSNGDCEDSLIFNIFIPDQSDVTGDRRWVGWERNEKGNFGPRLANMASSMDPLKLAESSVDLNLKLMKWRLLPNLDLDIIKNTKCLLLGAGTLGCSVARSLLSWGIRKITLIDNGKVSYSNPVRQNLYFHEDCLNGGKSKAIAAADNLKKIYPGVESRGIILHIPMPGHPVGDTLKTEIIKDISILAEEVSNHDILFLLLDSREARWLPTLLGTYFGKIVINAALGFDSYLVMRHGVYEEETNLLKECNLDDVKAHAIPGNKLGCYFCNDVTAPGNSQKDRTLDQQCTVTRPGVSSIAGALAAEIAISLTQHKNRINAPAPYNLAHEDFTKYMDEDSLFGMIPHSIRGFLTAYQQVLPTSGKFKQCIACSDTVVNLYRREQTDFLIRVFNTDKYLEEVTGLSDLHANANTTEMWALNDSDDDFSE